MANNNNLPWYLKGFWIFVLGIFTGGCYWFVGITLRIVRSFKKRNYELYSPPDLHFDSGKILKIKKPKSALTIFGIVISVLWTLLILLVYSGMPNDVAVTGWGATLVLFWIVLFIIKGIIHGIKKLINKIFMRDSNGNSTVGETVFIPPVQDEYIPEPIIPTPELFPEPVPEPEPEVPQLPVYDTMEGHDFEYYCADLLRNDGFCNVEVTQGSGDQGIDILAEKAGIRYGIQCKCYSNNIGNKAVQEAFAGKTFYHCHVAAVLTNRYFTRSAKQLAEKDQVLLWDRDELERLVHNAER